MSPQCHQGLFRLETTKFNRKLTVCVTEFAKHGGRLSGTDTKGETGCIMPNVGPSVFDY